MKKKYIYIYTYTYTYKTRDSDDQFSPRPPPRHVSHFNHGIQTDRPNFATMRATKETEMNKR